MKRAIYKLHLFLGIFVSIPVLAWSLSGLLYTIPAAAIEGGSVIERIDPARVRVSPADAIMGANDLAGRTLPITALTLVMKDGRPQYQAIGGLGADSIFVDAETGKPAFATPPTWRTRFFREAHFYFFAGEWQVPLLMLFSLLAALSALSGIYLNVSYWSRRITGRASQAVNQSFDN